MRENNVIRGVRDAWVCWLRPLVNMPFGRYRGRAELDRWQGRHETNGHNKTRSNESSSSSSEQSADQTRAVIQSWSRELVQRYHPD
jgi:hypothetical protein